MIVLDASAAVELILRLPLGDAVAERLVDPDVAVHAPHLLSVEAAQVVRRYVLLGTHPAHRLKREHGDHERRKAHHAAV